MVLGASKTQVIVTRPRGAEKTLCELLAGRGYEVQHLPMLETVSSVQTQADAEKALVKAFGLGGNTEASESKALTVELENIVNSDKANPLRAIFVSANAVRYTRMLIDKLAQPMGQLVNQLFGRVPCIGMGQASESAITEQGWLLEPLGAHFKEGAIRSEDLLDCKWSQAEKLSGRQLLICRGRGGRTFLGDELAARGARVAYLESYRRIRPDLAETEERALRKAFGQSRFVLVSSGETAENFLAQLRESFYTEYRKSFDNLVLANWTFILPSERVKEIVSQSCPSVRCLVARNATDQAMIDALVGSNLS